MGTSDIEHKEEEESKEERLDKIAEGLDSTEADDEAEEKGEGDEEGQEAETTTEKEAEKEEVTVLTPEESNRELKQIVREQKRQMAMMQAKLNRLDKRSKAAPAAKDEADLFSEEDTTKKETEEEELSRMEILQNQVEVIGAERGPVLEVLVETMEQNKNFEDIREVCSQSNFDDIFESVGKAVADKEGVDPLVAQLEFEANVWSMPNPYKYMYGLIKEYHPSYAKPEEKKEDTEDKDKDTSSKETKPAEAPTSIANIKGADTKGSSGWTAERIDNLPEDELDKVPPDVYDKYLAGDLD